jgi:hypothetical protein
MRYFASLKMKADSIITKITGLLLICTFAIGITPKSAFHDLFANHNDECFDNHQFKGVQLTKQGFSCHFENLVVESPYIWQPQPQQSSINSYFTSYQSLLQVDLYSQDHYYSELRGPPFLI